MPAGTGAVAMDRRGRFVAAAQRGGALVVPLDGGKPRALEGFLPTTIRLAVAIDRDGRRVAAASYLGPRRDKVIRVWDLDHTGTVWTLGPTEKAGEGGAGQNIGIGFLADGSLVSAGDGLRLWSIEEGTHELVGPSHVQSHLTVFPDGRTVAYMVAGDRADAAGEEQRRAESVWLAITDVRRDGRASSARTAGASCPSRCDPTGTVRRQRAVSTASCGSGRSPARSRTC